MRKKKGMREREREIICDMCFSEKGQRRAEASWENMSGQDDLEKGGHA